MPEQSAQVHEYTCSGRVWRSNNTCRSDLIALLELWLFWAVRIENTEYRHNEF